MGNAQFVAVTLLMLAMHVVSLAVAVLGAQGARALLPANLLVAGAVLAYLAAHPRLFDGPADWQILGLLLLELLALAAALGVWWQYRLALTLSCVVFAAHALASIGAAVFALTFRITRLN